MQNGNGNPAFIIDASNNIVIETLSGAPGFKLSVWGTSHFDNGLVFSASYNSRLHWSGYSNAFIGRTQTAAAHSDYRAISDLILSYDNRLLIKSGGAANIPAIGIDTSNNVGIGGIPTNSGSKFQITGGAFFSGSVSLSSN